MSLNTFAAEKRMKIFDDLKRGLPPSEGSFDADILKEAKVKGEPQVGTTRYKPNEVILEYIYPDPQTTSAVLSVHIEPPERIVFMPVPDWVVESIWQGEIDGSYHFESDATALFESFSAEISPSGNEKWFGPRQPKRRE